MNEKKSPESHSFCYNFFNFYAFFNGKILELLLS